MAVVDTDLSEALRFVPVDGVILAQPAAALDSVRVGESLLAYYGAVIAERLGVLGATTANEIGHVTLSDVIDIVGSLYRAEMISLADGVGVAQLEVLQRAVGIVEQLGLSEALQGAGAYHMSLTQGFRLLTSLGNFFGVDIAEDLGLNDSLFARALHFAGVTDVVDIDNFLVPQVFFHVALEDGVDIEPVQLLNMIWQPTLLEEIEFEAGYLAPNGSFTAWAMNTRTGAVTEYDNFVFNSFAQVGNLCLGASDSGLYELRGDDDDGADIVARIKGGFLQFGGTQLSRLKEAYIATTGDGQFVLKIRTKDGLEYNYSVDARSGRSAKVHMGKGQRSRYFGFELISAGQDFDLDTLEFVPIVVQRRV
jgi:hypothetical protein